MFFKMGLCRKILVRASACVSSGLALILFACAPAHGAQSNAGVFNVSLLAGYRDGGRFEVPESVRAQSLEGSVSGGAILGLKFGPGFTRELSYLQQRSSLSGADIDVDVAYIHYGKRLDFPARPFRPYVSAGIGATRIGARGEHSDSFLRPSVSVAGGLEWPLAKRLAVRLEARGYLTLSGGMNSLLCVSEPENAFCEMAWSGDVFGQVDLLGGLTFRF